MIFEQYYLGCLAQASYLVGDGEAGVAAVVDPRRDVEVYLEDAARLGVQIRYVVLTHFHADFIAGHLELRERVGAEICLGARARAEYAFRALEEGDELALGRVKMRVLHTPGHTPESITLVVVPPDAKAVWLALTGDTLFAGDVGRPDLRAALGWSGRDLGGLLYDSLQAKILPLPDSTRIYPAHGPGSLCGKQIGGLSTTLGEQRRLNYALQPMSKDRFVEMVLSDQPEAPSYFTYDAVLNSRERPNLDANLARTLQGLTPEALERKQAEGIAVLDTRPAADFARVHWRGAINIPLEGAYAPWCGTILGAAVGAAVEGEESPRVALITAPGCERESALRLGRIGFDQIEGYLDGGLEAVAEAGGQLASRQRLRPEELEGYWLLDVRTPAEREAGYIPGSAHIPLPQLAARRAEVKLDQPIAVYCRSGYRSSIAASLLAAWGAEQVTDLAGGYQAWQQSRPALELS